jgi:hypothetical protein
MNGKLMWLLFLGVNLVAAYMPAVLYVPHLPGTASIGWKYLFSPVLLLLLIFWINSASLAWAALLAFLAILFVLSFVLHRSLYAWFILPGMVLVYATLQGLFASRILHGIDAL